MLVRTSNKSSREWTFSLLLFVIGIVTYLQSFFSAYAGKEYKIYVNVHIFGFEELLYALASSGLKVGLESSQKRLFRYSGHEDLFEFEGSPDITVFASGIRKNEFTWGGYTR